MPNKYDKRRYRSRNRIEIIFGRLKDWRRVATRYDRCPTVVFFAIAQPIRRTRLLGWHYQGWRCQLASRAVSGRDRHDASRTFDMAENMAAQVTRPRGEKRTMVALARRIGVILHRMWVDDTDFRSGTAMSHAA